MLYAMADNNVVIPAERDGALYNFLMGGQDYVFANIGDAFEITPSSTSFLVTLGEGEGVVSGRHITEETVSGANSMIQLDPNSSGYVVIRVDLTRPVGTEAFLYATPVLSAQDLNNSGTVHDLPLYQYTTNASGVSSFTDVRPLSNGSNVVCLLENGTIYVEQWNNGVKTRKQVGSLDPDVLTATPSDVKSGVTFGGSGSDDPQTGTFSAQTKSISPSAYAQSVVPDNGSYLEQVNVNKISGAWVELYVGGSGDGTARSYTTTQDYTGLLVCWNNSVDITLSQTPAYNSGSHWIPNLNCRCRFLLGVPSGTVITHPAYNPSTGNCLLRIYKVIN